MSRPLLFQSIAGLYTQRPFQTSDGRMAESRMDEEEAYHDLKLEEMIKEVREDEDVTEAMLQF